MSGITQELELSMEDTNCVFPPFEEIQEGIEVEHIGKTQLKNEDLLDRGIKHCHKHRFSEIIDRNTLHASLLFFN